MAHAGGIAVAVAIVTALLLWGAGSTGPTLQAEAVATSVKVLPLEIVTSLVKDALTR